MSTFWKIFISVVVTIAVVGSGVFYLMQKQIDNVRNDNLKQIDDLNKQIKTLKSTSAAPATTPATTDETASWKTYTNDTYGFSFKYPATLSVTDTLSQSGNWSVSKKVIIKDTTDSMEVWVNPDGFGPFFPDFSYDITASASGLTVVSKDAGTSAEKSDGETLAISQFTYKTTEFLVHYRIKGSDSKPLTQFDKMLSTFQFTK